MYRIITRVLITISFVGLSSVRPPSSWALRVTEDLCVLSCIDQTNAELIPIYTEANLPADVLHRFPSSVDDGDGPWLKMRLWPGDLACERHLSEARGIGGPYIPHGMRLITVPVSADVAVQAGDRVNYIVQLPDMPSEPPILIAHNIEVFGSEPYIDPCPSHDGQETRNIHIFVSVPGACAVLAAQKTPNAQVEVEVIRRANPSVCAATP